MLKEPVVILANGNFPSHEIPLKKLHEAKSIICCDGAINALEQHGIEPIVIVGDLDSMDEKLKQKYQSKLFHIPDQNENDLRKAMAWTDKNKINHATILGATGKREDHSLGNIFSLIQFETNTIFSMISNHGSFITIEDKVTLKSFKGEQVSIFSADPTIKITSDNLKYNLINYTISSLYSCTLNESLSNKFTLQISHGKVAVYQAFIEK